MKKDNVVSCPPCGENVGLPTKRGLLNKGYIMDNPPSVLRTTSPAQGGKETTRGFTLIELLVVVLIIGILAAVAVPQYQKAVEKSRAATMFALVDAFHKAEKVYYVGNGVYPTKLTELDVELPGDWALDNKKKTATKGKQKIQLGGEGSDYSIRGHWDTNMDAFIEIYPGSSAGYCWANRNDVFANQICQSFTSKKASDNPSDPRIGYQFK